MTSRDIAVIMFTDGKMGIEELGLLKEKEAVCSSWGMIKKTQQSVGLQFVDKTSPAVHGPFGNRGYPAQIRAVQGDYFVRFTISDDINDKATALPGRIMVHVRGWADEWSPGHQ